MPPQEGEPEEVTYEIEVVEDDEIEMLEDEAEATTPEAAGMPNILHDGELSELLKKVYADFRGKMTPLLTPLSPAPAPADPWQWPAFDATTVHIKTSVTLSDLDRIRLRAGDRTIAWGGRSAYWDAVDAHVRKERADG